jgi:hypothetical protein
MTGERAGERWWPAKVASGIVWSLLSVAVFTPWFRHAPCPARIECEAPWSNILGWEFEGAFPYWIPVTAALAGFAIGWAVVTLLQHVPQQAAFASRGHP